MEGVEHVGAPQMLHLYPTVCSFRDWNILLILPSRYLSLYTFIGTRENVLDDI